MVFNLFSGKKKASANMWWIIIGAVIALVVMIILLVMFTGRSNDINIGILDCTSKGGHCVDSENQCSDGTISHAFKCDDPQICCFESRDESRDDNGNDV